MLNEVKHLSLVQPAESFKGIRFFASLRMTTLCLLAAGKASFGSASFDFAQDKQDKQGLALPAGAKPACGRQAPLPNCLGFD